MRFVNTLYDVNAKMENRVFKKGVTSFIKQLKLVRLV